MKIARVVNNVVIEIIPDYAFPVEKWYNIEFANECIEVPDYVEENWICNFNNFFPPENSIIELTSAQLREQAYNNDKVIDWEGQMITITEASQLWQYYAAEGSLKATLLQELIANAKTNIRLKYSD